jgi:5-methylcytosine-specific restriction protein A
MPSKFCKCGAVIGAGGCGRCRKPVQSMTYKTTKQRGYGADWKDLSERYRAQYPLCEDCLKEGKVTPSSEVHHVIPISEQPSLRLTWTNLVALCNTCHSVRHVAK